MCKRYIENAKGQINKTLAVQALQGCRLAAKNSLVDKWNTKSLGLPYSIKYLAIISVIYQREKV
jgi:hypothetical protein